MIIQAAISGTFFLIAIGSIVRANLLFHEIVTEINRRLPGGARDLHRGVCAASILRNSG